MDNVFSDINLSKLSDTSAIHSGLSLLIKALVTIRDGNYSAAHTSLQGEFDRIILEAEKTNRDDAEYLMGIREAILSHDPKSVS